MLKGISPAEKKGHLVMKKLYFREIGKWVEMKDEVYYPLARFFAAIRMNAQYNGRCRIPKDKNYLCDGVCDGCPFYREGYKTVAAEGCSNCRYGVEGLRKGRAFECGNCCNYAFLENASLDEKCGDVDSPSHIEFLTGADKSPEEIFIENETIEEYKVIAENSIKDGRKIVEGFIAGDTVSEIARDIGSLQQTINSRKSRLKEAFTKQAYDKLY